MTVYCVLISRLCHCASKLLSYCRVCTRLPSHSANHPRYIIFFQELTVLILRTPLFSSPSLFFLSLSSSPSIAVFQEVSLPVQRELVSVQLCMVDLLALVFAEHGCEQRVARNTLHQKSSIEKVCSIMHVNVLTLRGKKKNFSPPQSRTDSICKVMIIYLERKRGKKKPHIDQSDCQ